MIDKEVAVIIINYNGYADTIECISSIQRNSYQNYYIILVDNASPDRSGLLLRDRYKDDNSIEVILSDKNGGFAAGNNIGIRRAIALNLKYVLLLNNDTIVEKNFLSNMVANAIENKTLYTGKIYYYYEPTKVWCAGGEYNWYKGTVTHRKIGIIEGVTDNITEVDFLCGCYIFLSTASLKEIGMLPEEYFLYSEDLDYSLKAKTMGYNLKCIESSIIYHKVSASTSKLSKKTQYFIIRNRYYVIKKYHKGLKRLTALIYTTLGCAKRIFKGEYSFNIFIKAYRDFKLMCKEFLYASDK